MSLLAAAHGVIILCYIIASYFIWRGWNNNRLEKKFNTALRDSAIAIADNMLEEVARNEKLVAEAKSQVAAAMAAVKADIDKGCPTAMPDDPNDMMNDPALLGSVLAAIVVKYGEMRLGLKDMALMEGNDYVSVYIDTATKEMILSTEHNQGDGISFFNHTDPGDDETYH